MVRVRHSNYRTGLFRVKWITLFLEPEAPETFSYLAVVAFGPAAELYLAFKFVFHVPDQGIEPQFPRPKRVVRPLDESGFTAFYAFSTGNTIALPPEKRLRSQNAG